MVKKYYQLDQNSEENADLYIFGDICAYPWEEFGEKSGYSIVKDLQAVEARKITVHINSCGGDVAEGLAIHNVLKNCGREVTTICDGFACSAASVVFVAGSRRIMNPASLLMIHNAWTWVAGNAGQLRKAANDIETITQASIEAYKARATISEEEIKRLMDDETWILPVAAVEYGFATEIADEQHAESAQQSAFRLIMRKLTAAPVESVRLPAKQSEQGTPINGWDKFFTKKEIAK